MLGIFGDMGMVEVSDARQFLTLIEKQSKKNAKGL